MTSYSDRGVPGVFVEALLLLWRVIDSYARRRLLIALGLVAGAAVVAALAPVALRLAVDALTSGQQTNQRAPVILIALYIGCHYIARLCTELRLLTSGQGEQRVRRRISGSMFEHVIRLPLERHLTHKSGAIGEVAEQGTRGYQLVLSHLIGTILPIAVEFLVVSVVLLRSDHPRYLAILAASVLAYMLAFRHSAMGIRAPAETASGHHIQARGILTDVLINCETVKCFGAERFVADRYDAALRLAEKAWQSLYRHRAFNGTCVATIFSASLGLTLFSAAAEVQQGTMTLGDFVLVHAYVLRLIQPLEMLGFAMRDTAQGLAFLRTLLALFRERTELDPRLVVAHSRPVRGELAFDRVSFSYSGRPALQDVSFLVPAGRVAAVVGPTGSGKSSLVRLVCRLFEPDAGRILLDGVPISEMPLSAVRQSIAVVPQDTVLFHDTIGRNIGFGRFGADASEIQAAARVANLHELIMELPDRYDTVVGERGLQLSGGERQRVAIARAVLKRPRIFVFDEATSSLDPTTERDILRNLADVASHTTTLIIAHRLATIQHADEILVLDRGRIVERGTHPQLLARHGTFSKLWLDQEGRANSAAGSALSINRRQTSSSPMR